MIIPGSNLLRLAARLIQFQTVQYYPFQGRQLNDVKQWVSTFGTPFPLTASVQAIDRNRYADMGLDFNSDYIQLWSPLNMVDLMRDSSGDRLIWNGEWYQLKSEQSWYVQDGWAQAIAVKVANVSDKPTPD